MTNLDANDKNSDIIAQGSFATRAIHVVSALLALTPLLISTFRVAQQMRRQELLFLQYLSVPRMLSRELGSIR